RLGKAREAERLRPRAGTSLQDRSTPFRAYSGPPAGSREGGVSSRLDTIPSLQLDQHLLNLARELAVGAGVVFDHGGAAVHSDVGALVGGVDVALGAVDVAFGDFLAVDQYRALAARARRAAVGGELKTDRRLACRHGFLSTDGVALQAQPGVSVGGL